MLECVIDFSAQFIFSLLAKPITGFWHILRLNKEYECRGWMRMTTKIWMKTSLCRCQWMGWREKEKSNTQIRWERQTVNLQAWGRERSDSADRQHDGPYWSINLMVYSTGGSRFTGAQVLGRGWIISLLTICFPDLRSKFLRSMSQHFWSSQELFDRREILPTESLMSRPLTFSCLYAKYEATARSRVA